MPLASCGLVIPYTYSLDMGKCMHSFHWGTFPVDSDLLFTSVKQVHSQATCCAASGGQFGHLSERKMDLDLNPVVFCFFDWFRLDSDFIAVWPDLDWIILFYFFAIFGWVSGLHTSVLNVWNFVQWSIYSPVATGDFGGLSPPKQSSKPPKLKHETL